MFLFSHIFWLFFCVHLINSERIVQYAAVLFRHGDRTPINPYPNDPYRNESLWPVKFGELTNRGTSEHYHLGQWLKNRYEDLLSEQYDPKEIFVRSTDTDRTISSALANLAGMFPPKGNSVWNEDLLWRPIPVHSVPEEFDEVLGKKKCPTYDIILNEVKNSKSYRNELSKYQLLMKYLATETGAEIHDYEDIEYIYSTLKIEKEHNFSLPQWTRAVFPYDMKKPACHSFAVPTLGPDLARIKAGPLLKDIVGHMAKAAVKENTIKLSIYSAHDNNVANFLNALKMFDEHCPLFTATVLVELVNDTDVPPHMFVRILYKNSTEIVEPYLLNIPHCGQLCPLEKFIGLHDYLIHVDWDIDCTTSMSPMIIFMLYQAIVLIGIWYFKYYGYNCWLCINDLIGVSNFNCCYNYWLSSDDEGNFASETCGSSD